MEMLVSDSEKFALKKVSSSTFVFGLRVLAPQVAGNPSPENPDKSLKAKVDPGRVSVMVRPDCVIATFVRAPSVLVPCPSKPKVVVSAITVRADPKHKTASTK